MLNLFTLCTSLKFRVIAGLLFCATLQSVAQHKTVVRAADYGVKVNSFENAALPLQRALAACKQYPGAVLELPGGRIDVWPEDAPRKELYISNTTESDTASKVKHIAFLVEDFNNLIIEGNNSLVVLHGKMVSFAVLKSRNIRVQHIGFDYERPTMSELKITRVDSSRVEASIHPGTRFIIDHEKLVLYGEGWKAKSFHTIAFDPSADRLRYSTLAPLLEARARQTGINTVVFKGQFKKGIYKAGDVLTVRDPYRDNCGGFVAQCKNVELYDVQMRYMHGLGIVSQFTENIALRRVVAAPAPESGRVIAAFADCFHFSGCRGKVIIDSCRTSGAHDDPVNIHGTHLQITGINEKGTITVRFMHHQTYGFPAFFENDSIAFINPQTLLPVAMATIKSATLINTKEMELVLNEAIPAGIKNGLTIENITWTPEVQICNSRFERTNTRGILVTTRRKVVIENNTFYHTGMFPVLIADDAASWFESGPVQDVAIRNNVFDGCGYNSGSGAIAIAPENRLLVPGQYVHRNVSIVNNEFRSLDGKVLTARSVDGLRFSGNRIIMPSAKQGEMIIDLAACRNVVVVKNQTGLTGTGRINIKDMKPGEVSTNLKLIEQP